MTSPKTPAYWRRATRELGTSDPVLGALIVRYKGLTLSSRGDAFQTLARSIIGQQISVKAAQSVWLRFAAAVGEIQPKTCCNCRSNNCVPADCPDKK